MTPIIEEKALALLTELEKGIEFGKEQAPIIVEQLLIYHLWSAIISVLISTLVLIAYGTFLYRTRGSFKNYEGWHFISFMSGFAAFVAFLVSLTTILQVSLAPNLYVLEYVLSLK
jgi:hypothetical protein